jgi:uncharacterized membrane protein
MDTFPIPAPAYNGNSRTVPAGNAFEWFKQGWEMFVVNPGLWIALAILFLVIVFGLHVVPVLGWLAAYLFMPVLGAGLLCACSKAAGGEAMDVGDLFAGFKRNTSNLIMIGVVYLAGLVAIFVIVGVFGGGSLASGLMLGRPAGIGLAIGGMLFASLLSMLLLVPLWMALWFAPALVFFNNMQPAAALKASFNACMKNMLPFLVYGLILMVLGFFAMLPVGLGLLVLIPVASGSLYASYRDVFVAN